MFLPFLLHGFPRLRSASRKPLASSSRSIRPRSERLIESDACNMFDGMRERSFMFSGPIVKEFARVGCFKNLFLALSAVNHRAYSARPASSSGDPADVIRWNGMMSENLKRGNARGVFEGFRKKARLGVGHDFVTLFVLLGAVVALGSSSIGRQAHSISIRDGYYSCRPVRNSLINMYAKLQALDCARKVFDELPERDSFSWNSMISAYATNGLHEESVGLFLGMFKNGMPPDEFALASVLRACSGIVGEKALHKQIHAHVSKAGFLRDAFVATSLVDAYCKAGSLDEGNSLLSGTDRFDIASYNALISGYVASLKYTEALDLFIAIQRSDTTRPNKFTLATVIKACTDLVACGAGKQIHALAIKCGLDSDLCVSSGLLNMYVKSGRIQKALAVFSGIHEADEVAWTAMISGCVENGKENHALSLYNQMRQLGLYPDEYTLASLFKACSCLTALERGKQIHANAIKLCYALDTFVGTSVVDMYAKCGNLGDSHSMFEKMNEKTAASWNAMLLGYAQHGFGIQALDLFRTMKLGGITPNKVTFVGVLTACSHSGLVSEAYRHLDSMRAEYNIEPEVEHYSCLVDVLGRAGLLTEAVELIEDMPFDASASTYKALLGACKIRGNTQIGKHIAAKLLELEPRDSSGYVLASNMYAAGERWDDVADARRSMMSMKIRKDPGYSWIEIKNKVHLLVVDDKSHPEVVAIYDELEDLIRRIKSEGYIPDIGSALFDVEREEKEHALYYHSEKLTIAYGLLAIPAPQRIRVIKNLRVCGDCHIAIRYISKVAGREIILRDASRFHYFRDGVCSCNDY